MKNKYKVVALVPLEFSVKGSSDSKEAIEYDCTSAQLC